MAECLATHAARCTLRVSAEGVQESGWLAGTIADRLQRSSVIVPPVAAGGVYLTADAAAIRSQGKVYVTLQQ